MQMQYWRQWRRFRIKSWLIRSPESGALAGRASDIGKKRQYQAGDTPQQYDIHYWKNREGFEADFVIREGLSIKEVIQVTYELNSEKTKDREVRGLLACAKEAGLKHGLIITKDFERIETVDGIEIIFLPLWKWLLEI